MLISIATFQKHPYLGKIRIFSNVNFEITMFIQEQCLCLPPRGGGMKGPMGAKFFTQFFTNNFDINISLRELTQHTTEIHIFRPGDFTDMNIYLKSISIDDNVAL